MSETAAQVWAEIVALKARIEKTEQAQSYDTGMGMRLQRGDLAAMYKRLEHLEQKHEKLVARESGGAVNLVKFVRPR